MKEKILEMLKKAYCNIVNWDGISTTFLSANKVISNLFCGIKHNAKNGRLLSQNEVKFIFAKAILVLAKYPIATSTTLEQILMAYRPSSNIKGLIFEKSKKTYPSDKISRLYDVIKELEPDFDISHYSLGECSRVLIAHWDEVCGYEETYCLLADIVQYENIYHRYSTYDVLTLLHLLAYELRHNHKFIDGTKIPIKQIA